MVEINSVS